jgi:hypothetical protein
MTISVTKMQEYCCLLASKKLIYRYIILQYITEYTDGKHMYLQDYV